MKSPNTQGGNLGIEIWRNTIGHLDGHLQCCRVQRRRADQRGTRADRLPGGRQARNADQLTVTPCPREDQPADHGHGLADRKYIDIDANTGGTPYPYVGAYENLASSATHQRGKYQGTTVTDGGINHPHYSTMIQTPRPELENQATTAAAICKNQSNQSN